MKLATLLFGFLLASTGTASADEVLHPPGGTVYVSDPPPMRAEAPRGEWRRERADARRERADARGGMAPGERAQRGRQLRRALVETFDVNGDGRLGPRERMRAARVLRRIERRLEADQMRGRAVRGAIRRYDLNGDGNVGPGEMPPAAARRLRPLDRDGDGWVEPREYR
jgi:hypothetical protein